MAKSKLPKDMTTMAKLSADVYNPRLRRKSISGWEYQPELSSTYHGVYYELDGNRAVVAGRGTKPTDVSDLVQDLNLLVGSGSNSSRVKTLVRTGKKVERSTGRRVIYTGHSLSGTLALHAGRTHDREVHAFNMGASPSGMMNEVYRMAKCAGVGKDCVDEDSSRKHHVYHNPQDPLSVASYKFQAQHHETPSKWTGFDAHGLDQFIS